MTFEKALTAKPEFSGVSGSIAGETGANAGNGLAVAGGTREPDEIVRLAPCGAARMNVRVYLKPEKQHCHASRDGECDWAYCPQLRDNEPYATGRHCPYDHWCYYCGEDEADGHDC